MNSEARHFTVGLFVLVQIRRSSVEKIGMQQLQSSLIGTARLGGSSAFIGKSAHIAAAKTAKDVGAILSYDPPNLRIPLWPYADNTRDEIFRTWDTADIIKICEEEIEFLTKGEDYVNLGLFASAMISSVRRKGGPYTNQGDDLSHGKRLEEMRPPMMLGGRLFGRSSIQSVGLQRQREGVAANAQPREQREEFVPVERDSRLSSASSRKNGAKWFKNNTEISTATDQAHVAGISKQGRVFGLGSLQCGVYMPLDGSTVSPQADEDDGTLTHRVKELESDLQKSNEENVQFQNRIQAIEKILMSAFGENVLTPTDTTTAI
ncbi:hypothetical protein Bca101_031524 [Brassica carinata]